MYSKMSNYQEYYGIRFFDDLHNYLPEILYGDINQFRPAHNIITYVRNQVRNHTDLFTNASRNHTRINTRPVNTTQPHLAPLQTEQIRLTFNMDDINTNSDLDSYISLLRNILINPWPNFTEAVIVRPTQTQINSGTSIISVTNLNTSDLCAICQDSLVLEGNRVRKINQCSHMFHDNCILRWFNTNVHCPTCRHDIRVTNT